MEYIWECMNISFMGMLGMIFWSIAITVFGFIMVFLAFMISGEWHRKNTKPKYNGEKIIIQGGKKDE